jgi:DNA polymerase-3 subunit delta'
MAFDQIPGNAPLKDILRSALRRKSVLPSLLFCGSEGAGQRETVLELAKAFNCERQSDDACDECASCKAIDARNHPDVIDVINLPRKKKKNGFNNRDEDEAGGDDKDEEPEDCGPKPRNIVIDQMRRAIELALMKPMIGRKRIFLVDDASEMEEEAANASLKILEEPPTFTQFVLITSNPDLLLPTIRSRCQMFAFGPVGTEDIVAVLRGRGLDDVRARVVASTIRGNYQKALTMDWDEFFEERGRAWELFRAILTGPDGTEFVREFAGGRKAASREDMEAVLVLFRGFGRDLLLLGETEKAAGLLNPDFEDGLRELAFAVPPGRALGLIRAVDTAIVSLDKNANIRLMTSVLFARMTG